jgi:hypothetical protein
MCGVSRALISKVMSQLAMPAAEHARVIDTTRLNA